MLVEATATGHTSPMRIRPEQLPLVSSIEETVELWPKLSTTQRFGACAASLITLAGPVARLINESRRDNDAAITLQQFAANVAIDLRDGLDGKVARATGGVTPFGKELDPLADKIDFLIQEIAMVRRGELPASQLGLRVARDAIVTALRSHVMDISGGEAHVGAAWYGKASTATRQVSNRMTGLPFEESRPTLRRLHQSAATALLIYSGAKNIQGLLAERQKYL